jgi:hypothetical protein
VDDAVCHQRASPMAADNDSGIDRVSHGCVFVFFLKVARANEFSQDLLILN